MLVLDRTKHADKRDFLRMEMDIPVTLTDSMTGQQVTGICRDLSGTGMLVEMRVAPREGIRYDVSVPATRPDLDLGSLEASVEVTRVIPRGDGFEVGMKICGIKP